MKDINEGLDPENPSHAIVIEINKRNEELYGKLHDCGLFETFCRCKPKEKELTKNKPYTT